MIRPLLTLGALTAALLVLGACGGGDNTPSAGDRPQIVATTGVVADIVRHVAGERAEVTQLVPDSADPHSWAPSAKDRRRLLDADLVVAVGHGYEEALDLEEVADRTFALADHVGRLRRATADDEHGHGGDEHREAGAPIDPHVWMDPTRVASALPALAGALADADAGGAAGYRRRADRFAARLDRLDAELRRTLAAIPPQRRLLVTSHRSLGYFAERYDLDVVGAPFGVAQDAEASAEEIAHLIEEVRDHDLPAVFAQQGDDPKVMRQIAREARVRIVDDLLVENPGPRAPGYLDMLRWDARRIADALGR